MTSHAHALVIAAAMSLAPVTTSAVGDPVGPTISVGPIRITPAPAGAPGRVEEFTVTVRMPDGPARHFVVRSPDGLLAAGPQPRATIVADRLLVVAHTLIAVLDLQSGERLLDLTTGPEVTVSGDGRRVAFESWQRRLTPPEASSSVIQVLDVLSLAVEPAFPERSLIAPAQFGELLTWIEEPSQRHSAGQLALSPDGSRLAFFCYHSGNTVDIPGEIYLVVEELAEDLSRSRFVHEPFDWMAFLRPEMAAGERRPIFAIESVTWAEDHDALVLRAEPYALWLPPEFKVPLPDQAPEPESPNAANKEGRP